MACLAGDIELPAQHRHLLAIKQSGNKSEPFVHFVTLLPRHLRLPQMPESVTYVPGMMCNLCVRKDTLQKLSELCRGVPSGFRSGYRRGVSSVSVIGTRVFAFMTSLR